MKIFSILLACAALVAFTPAQAQGRRARSASASTSAASAEATAPKTGVRFVICSPSGVNMPSPLYVRNGKEFMAISIGSRTPSVRVKPVGGVVEFWKENPQPAAGMMSDAKAASAQAKLPAPIFKVSVPASAGSKTVCILSPNKDVEKTASLFLNEADFPKKGMHVINLSSYPLQIMTSQAGDFSDAKTSKVGVYRREDGICPANSWSFNGEKGQQVGFILSYLEKGAKAPKRLKASTFVLSEKQSVLNIVVRDPGLNRPRLMSIQLTEGKN